MEKSIYDVMLKTVARFDCMTAIRRLLSLNGVNQAQAADMVGVFRNEMNLWYRGRRKIAPSTVIKLSEGFDITPATFLQLQTEDDIINVAVSREALKDPAFKKHVIAVQCDRALEVITLSFDEESEGK